MTRTITVTTSTSSTTYPAAEALELLKPLLPGSRHRSLRRSALPAHVFFMPDGHIIVDFLRSLNVTTTAVPQPAHEKNDCSVRAVSNACAVPYKRVHRAFADAGREQHQGVSVLVAWKVAQQFGAGRLVTRRSTLAAFIAKHQKGRWVVWTTGHVLAVVDGRVLDNEPSGGAKRVHGYWRCS